MKKFYLMVSIALVMIGCGSPARTETTTTTPINTSIPEPTIEDSSKKPPTIPNI